MLPEWVKNKVIYNVYPQSFMDTNGDGIGDLNGIAEKLDYIKDLGCDIIWMNPIFESPFRDAGYDVTDFYKIAPRYGTNEDLRSLCKKAKEKDMYIILDLVPGHTSLECEWFQKSAEYDKNEYSNRYIWTNSVSDQYDGSFINGYSERNGSYMRNFYYCQPALNYGFAHQDKPWQLPVNHPDCVATQNELLRIMEYWTEYGVSGFRVDMAFSLVKNDKDNAATIRLWQKMIRIFKERHPDSLLLSEWGYPERAIKAGFDIDFLLHASLKAYTSLFRFEKGTNDHDNWLGESYFRKEGKGDFSIFANEYIDQLNKIKGEGYITIPSGIHDLTRTSLGRDEDDLKVIQAFLMTMPGIPLIYYGDEIGMRYIKNMRSVEGTYNRTGSRTPMQWDSGKNHGFSAADKTYIATDNSENAPTVEAQESDKNSLLENMKKLIKIRKTNPALEEDGDFKLIDGGYPAIYERTFDNEKIIIALNPSEREYNIGELPDGKMLDNKDVDFKDGSFVMKGRSYLIYKVLSN